MEPIFEFSEPAATAPTAPTPRPITPQTVEPHTSMGVSQSEAATLTAWTKLDLAAGKISQQQADQIFSEMETPATDRAPDTRSEDAKLLDQHFPIAKSPTEYTIQHGVDTMTPELRSFDTAARTWLHNAELPRELGNSFVTTISDVAKTTGSMTTDQREVYGLAEMAKLQQQFGDTLKPRLEAAKAMIRALDAHQPGLKQFIRGNACFDNARVVVQLLDASDRYWSRRKG